MDINSASPFAALSLIVAPAMLTNACSLLAMSTSNRLARAVDRARELSRQLEAETELASEAAERRLRELAASETRSMLLLRSLQSFYVALGSFASAALISLFGIITERAGVLWLARTLEVTGLLVGVFAVGALVAGVLRLVRETRIAVEVLTTRAERIRERARKVADVVSPKAG